MLKKVSIIAAVLCMAASFNARSQVVDLLGGYNFDTANSMPAVIIQAYGQDNFGDTYARSEFGFKMDPFSITYAYMEFARTLVFWKGTMFKDFGLHAEFNGYANFDNCNWLFGLDYTLPLKDLVKVSLLYKTFNGGAYATVPVQLSVLWDMKDLLNVKGLEFKGVAKAWGENTKYWYGDASPYEADPAYFMIHATPQIWYSVGQFFGWDGLSVGGEIDMAVNFMGYSGFRIRALPALRFSF
ncbi:MAG: DUF5020 family protein [Bacteroidales bacterium]|nr:DUF5020 family protein [Bacteroidales bacterium]